MLRAALWSRSSTTPQCTHVWVRSLRSLCGPSFWHALQIWLVFLGFTNRTVVCPALSALAHTSLMNAPQPASLILLFSPPLAAAPLGKNVPSSPRRGLGRLLMFFG